MTGAVTVFVGALMATIGLSTGTSLASSGSVMVVDPGDEYGYETTIPDTTTPRIVTTTTVAETTTTVAETTTTVAETTTTVAETTSTVAETTTSLAVEQPTTTLGASGAATTTVSPQLPQTGGDTTGWLGVLGALLVVIGGVMLMTARRTTSS